MRYRVALEESEEGFCVWIPGLPGCVSQGETEEEALANIADAIRQYLDVAAEIAADTMVRESRWSFRQCPGYRGSTTSGRCARSARLASV